jgi:hypothetical protein
MIYLEEIAAKGDLRMPTKKAPTGYYTASEAAHKLGLPIATFHYYVKQGKIPKYVPPLKTEGFYTKAFIDKLAATSFRVSTPEDAEGIVDVLKSLGWPTTTAQVRRARLEKNPAIDHVVVDEGRIQGYVNGMPLTPDALEGMMSGRLRSWDLNLDDILVFEPGHEYDLFVGLAERPTARERGYYGLRLVFGFRRVLEEWAARGIIIHRLVGHSDEQVGQDLARILGFIRIDGKPGDLFPRYELDLFTTNHRFLRGYRAIIANRGHG